MKIEIRIILVTISLALCGYTSAATIAVTSTGDTGMGSLRAALAGALDGDTIVFDLGGAGVISLTSGELLINKNIIILGPGASSLTVTRAQGASNFRILHITPGHTVTVQGLTITRGYINFGFVSGGGIYNDHSNLTVNNCVLTGNSSQMQGGFSGGAIGNNAVFSGSASLTVNDSIISDNNVDDNVTSNVAGGIYNFALGGGTATLTINNSTLSNNRAIQGGALFSDGTNHGHAIVTINNCTLTNNSARDGGAILAAGDENGDSSLVVNNCTFRGNSLTCICTTGAAILNRGDAGHNDGILEVRNAIFHTDPSLTNIKNEGGSVVSHGYNLTSDSGVVNQFGGIGNLNAATDQLNTDPMLDPAGLQNHGGPTPTIALLPGSPAVNTGDPTATARDQRYYLRINPPDRGAFEAGGTIAPLSSVSRKTHGAASVFDIDLQVPGPPGIECRSGGASSNHQVVATFATPVTIGGASVTTGIGNVTNAMVNGPELELDLAEVGNAQQMVVTVSGVSDGVNTNNVIIPMRVLLGDTIGTSMVNASDIGFAKGETGQTVSSTNFRADVNANGTVNASDVAIVKSQVGMGIPIPEQRADSIRR